MFYGYSFDYDVFLHVIKLIIKSIIGFGSLYLILQRFHLRLQMRFLKNISDEIIKINDFCIEFAFKHKQFLKTLDNKNCVKNEVECFNNDLVDSTSKVNKDKLDESNLINDELDESDSDKDELDEKLISEIESLRSKIKNHSDYLVAQLDAFPYGNPLNFFFYSLFGSYIWKKNQIEADRLLTIYQDSFLKDTIIQSETELSDALSDSKIFIIDKKQIDLIVISGIDLINFLEDHSKKIF